MRTALTFPRSVRSLVKVPSYRESSSHSRMPGPLKGREEREREVSLDRKPGWVGTDPQGQEHPSSGIALPGCAESHEPHLLFPLVNPQMRFLLRKCWLPLLPCHCPGSSRPIKSPFYCTCQETHRQVRVQLVSDSSLWAYALPSPSPEVSFSPLQNKVKSKQPTHKTVHSSWPEPHHMSNPRPREAKGKS